ncbi:MAG: hypothetical protein AAF847_20795 [Bacteroidota bacterium]
MKQTIFHTIIRHSAIRNVLYSLIATAILIACRKEDWTCTCTDINGNPVGQTTYNLTEKDAVEACDERDAQPNVSCILERE